MISDPRNISMDSYDYHLPESKIAQFPAEERDGSKLLVLSGGKVSEDRFLHVGNYLPDDSLIVFNETRVIHARLIFHKASGSRIEIFCLEPVEPAEIQTAFQQKKSSTWKCMIGNAKRWKSGSLEMIIDDQDGGIRLAAEMVSRQDDTFHVRFSWEPSELSFSHVLELFGRMPLPPYIGREADRADNDRYQTIYARQEGSVAAPTAGLHFTPRVMATLSGKNIQTRKITLHVGAGTFKPVSAERLAGHVMHTERVSIHREVINLLMESVTRKIVLVGTTTVRAVESLYWQGIKWLQEDTANMVMDVRQWDPYTYNSGEITVKEALGKILDVLDRNHLDHLEGWTSLLIAPGYRYRFPDYLITNFHQPKSTLLLLVSAFAGEEWKQAYDYALQHDFRFLSYGDSCLFERKR